MFYYLRGQVTLIDQSLAVLDCGGVGFSVNVSTNSLAKLKIGQEATLYTYCSIREDAFDIYGFYTRQELQAFRMLISVSGVGAKMALTILSAVTPDGLQLAVVTQNEKLLTAAPGVGKKTAQRILLELKDKLGAVTELDLRQSDGPTVLPAGPGSKAAEAIQALQALGYDQTTVTALMKGIDVEKLSIQDIIKQALRGTQKNT